MKKRIWLFSLASLALLASCGTPIASSSSPDNSIAAPSSSERQVLPSVEIKIELSQQIALKSSLYIKGSWDDFAKGVLLTKADDPFVYRGSLTNLKEGQYHYYCLLNDDEAYKEKTVSRVDLNIVQPSITHFVTSFIAEPVYESLWSVVNGGNVTFDEASDNSVQYSNSSWLSGFLTQKKTLAEPAYTISAHFQGTKTTPYTDETYVGLVPFYVDSSNYLVAYCQWCNWEGCTTIMREIGITGFINGVDQKWNDIFPSTNVTTTPKGGFSLSATRRGTSIEVAFVGDNGDTLTGAKSFSALKADTSMVGFWGENDQLTVKNFNIARAPDKPDLDKGWTFSSLPTGYIVTSETSLTMTANAWLGAFALRSETAAKGHYVVSATIKGTKAAADAASAFVGLVPFYNDNANFIAVYAQWTSGSVKSMGITGKSGGADLGWHDDWSFAGKSFNLKDGFSLSVEKNGGDFIVNCGGTTGTTSLGVFTNDDPVSVGLFDDGDTVSFSDFLVEGK